MTSPLGSFCCVWDIIQVNPNPRTTVPTMPIRILIIAGSVAGLFPGFLGAQEAPTYAEHVAPILNNRCVQCHRPGGIGPFSLLTYQDVYRRADRIVRATSAGVMPPWLPDAGYREYLGERRLSDEEIAIIQNWFITGRLAGDTTNLVAPSFQQSPWQLGTPDLVVPIDAFEVEPHDTDVYRNLVVPIPVGERRYVQSVELRPGGPNVVHHARMMVDTTSSSRELAAQDSTPGFDGMEFFSNAENPDGFFVGWTPGKVPFQNPIGMAWSLDPGTDLVLQLHLPASDETQSVAPEIGIHFAEGPPIRQPALLLLGSFDIDIPAGQNQYIVTDRYQLPVDASVLGLYPHAHYLAKTIEGYARLPNGMVEWLIRISDWDFNWQDEYRFVEPVNLPAGTVINMQITYDNSAANERNPSDPPARVVYGSKSTDEMADLVVQLVPQLGDDYDRLRGDLDLFHYSAVVTKIAEDAWQQGRLAAAEGKFEEAVTLFRESIANRIDDPRVHNDIGSALAQLGQNDQATAHFRQALRFAPGWPVVMTNLARHLALSGEDASVRSEALAIAQRAADLTQGSDPVILDVVALAYAANGRLDLAVRTAESAMELATSQSRPELADAIGRRLAGYREAMR
jgi:Flp pilus assembly protein TadD